MDRNIHLPGTAEDFIKANLGLARHIANKYYNENRDIDDLTGIAYHGLVKSYQRFDPTNRLGIDDKPIKFSTYAGSMINGYIMTYFRQVDRPINIGRKAIDLIYKMNSVDLHGNETIPEIADKAGISIEDANEAVMASIAKNLDSLDREIKLDGGSVPLSAMIGENLEFNEDQETIKDFMSQLSPRDYEMCRLRVVEEMTQLEASKIMGFSQSYFSRLYKRLMEKARLYGERERSLDNKEGGKSDMATNGTKKMRAEITTLEKFNQTGGAGIIAVKYGVSRPAVYLWKNKLAEGVETEVNVIKADTVRMETIPYQISDKEQTGQATEINTEGTGGVSEQSNDNRVGDCVQTEEQAPTTAYVCFGEFEQGSADCLNDRCRKSLACHAETIAIQTDHPENFETKDDLQGLADTEPTWVSDEPVNIEPMKPSEQIKIKWQNIEIELELIRMLYKEQAEELFKDRLAQAMRGLAV